MNQTKSNFLQISKDIANNICNDAIWHNDKCNWIGNQDYYENIYDYSSGSQTAVSALGPDFYEGTGGIAYFLSSVYQYEQDPDILKTIRGSINSSISSMEKIPTQQSLGFYSGKVGIIFTLLKIGENISDPNMIENSHALIKKLIRGYANSDNVLLDVISGHAGAISPLLYFYKATDDQEILDFAIKLGTELLSVSVKESQGISWDARINGIENTSQNLTGFAHGTAGVGWSLLELYNITHDEQFLHGGNDAFAYETSCFDDQIKSWPDFRVFDTSSSSDDEPNYAVAWCHGAPGIGLSRLRAYSLFNDDSYFEALDQSLSFTSDYLTNNMDVLSDFSLCHGLSGISDILIDASALLNDQKLLDHARQVGQYGISNYASDNSWPCGILQGITPNFMLGTAGIGYFYLRLYDSQKNESMLLLKP